VDLTAIVRTVVIINSLIRCPGEAVNPNDLEFLRYLGADVEWVRIIVGVRVFEMTAVKPALRVR
jgi:hypothetical protein